MNFVTKGVVYQKKKCIFAAENDARKVEQCGMHVYEPTCGFTKFIPINNESLPSLAKTYKKF